MDFKVLDDELWDTVKYLSREMTIDYEDSEPIPIAKRIKADIPLTIYGVNKKLRRELSESGKFFRYTYKQFSFLEVLGHMPPSGSELDIIVVGIILAIVLFLAIYYIILIPLLIIVLSVFTFGEAWTMMRRTIFLMPVDTSDETLCNKIVNVVRTVLLEKSAIEGIPEKCIPQDIKAYMKTLLSIHKSFWKGMALQATAIILFGILIGIQKYTGWLSSTIYFYSEISLGVLFLIGFFISVISGLRRKLTEVPSRLRFIGY